MKIFIYTENQNKGKVLKEAKDLMVTLFPDVELKSGFGKPKRTKKFPLEGFKFVALESFWKSDKKMSVMAFADIIGMGISERVLESL